MKKSTTVATMANGLLKVLQRYTKGIRLVAVLTMLFTVGVGSMWGADTWKLVTDASTLKVGDEVVIVASNANNAVSTTQNNNNRGQASVTKNSNTKTVSWTGSSVQILIIQAGKTSGTFAFQDNDGTNNGYLYAASSSKNYLRTETTLSANSSWTVTIASTGVATIKAKGTNTNNWLRYNSSSSIFSCYSSGQGDVCIYKKEVSSTKNLSSISVSNEQTNYTVGDEFVKPTVTATYSDATTADVTSSATFSGYNMSSIGEQTVTVSYTEGSTTKTATYNITVSAAQGGGGESGSGDCIWELVTDASTLNVGDRVVIAAKDYNYAISTTQNNNNRGQAAITKEANNITPSNDVQILTLQNGTKSGTFAFQDDNDISNDGYLYAASSGSNHLKTETQLSDNSSWSITIAADGTATLKAQGSNTRNVMQYNQSSSLFACYGSASQKALAIYKEVCTGGTTETSRCLTPTYGVTVAARG